MVTFPSDYRTAVAALNRGEPLMTSGPTALSAGFDQAARELGGLPPPTKDNVRPGLFSRVGNRR